jgi:hypothetical protein
VLGVAVAVLSYSGSPPRQTRDSIAQLRGCPMFGREGISDVTLGRAVLLTAVCDDPRAQRYDQHGAPLPSDTPTFDTVLLVDDDMVFTREAAERLVEKARKTQRAVSACYVTADGYSTATTWPAAVKGNAKGPDGELPFLVGLGLCAVPMRLLQRIASERPRVRVNADQQVIPFCTSGPDYSVGAWTSEDHSLCYALGGVLVEPVPAGHLKRIALYPDAESMARIVAGVELPKTPPYAVEQGAVAQAGQYSNRAAERSEHAAQSAVPNHGRAQPSRIQEPGGYPAAQPLTPS